MPLAIFFSSVLMFLSFWNREYKQHFMQEGGGVGCVCLFGWMILPAERNQLHSISDAAAAAVILLLCVLAIVFCFLLRYDKALVHTSSLIKQQRGIWVG